MIDRQKKHRFLAISLLIAIVAAFIYWVVPHQKTMVVTTDRFHQWAESVAPVRYQFVWRPPIKIQLPFEAEQGGSLILPQFADGGNTLYFTLRDRRGEADIYRSRLIDDSWQAAEPVTELNTPEDDIGSVISRDGSLLYLYSNRSEGQGGFDLYVSERSTDGWGTPRNLGPRINTLANEYAPAISPDGKTLYFSSNRANAMHQRTKGDLGDTPEWTATLRAQQPRVQYDLYFVQREGPEDSWPAAEPVRALNLDRSNEGTPFVSALGDFLYFASDRGVRPGEVVNYDLFRARIDGTQMSAVENLGPGVNTAANELDPALSRDGFRLIFSSDRRREHDESALTTPNSQKLYALYSTSATEVFEEVAMSEGGISFLLRHWWNIVLSLLVMALTAALIWYFRQVSLRRAPVPGFFLCALLVHLMLGGGMFFVTMGGDFVSKIRELADSVTSDFGDETRDRPRQAAYEKVEDLQSVTSVATTEVERQSTGAPDLIGIKHLDIAVVPTTTNVEKVPIEQIVFAPPDAVPTTQDQPKLSRRQMTALDRMSLDESIELAKTSPPEQTKEPEHQKVNVLAARSRVPRSQNTPQLVSPPQPVTSKSRPRLTNPHQQSITDQPISTRTPQPHRLERTARILDDPADDKIALDATAESATDSEKKLSTLGIDIGLERPDSVLSSAQVGPLNTVNRSIDRQISPLVGDGANEEFQAVPLFEAATNKMVRREGRSARTMYAGDDVGLSSLLSSRQGDMKKVLIEELGGNDETLEAVRRSLVWLEQHRFEDGHWSLHEFNKCCREHKKCNGHAAGTKSDVAATGFALLSFLGSGETHRMGKYQKTIELGLAWLVKNQQESGELTNGKEGIARMYSHAIGTIALCEAYTMTGDIALRDPSQRAIDLIVKAQDKKRGGWRYDPGQDDSDTSVVGWQVMALKSAEIAKLVVPDESFALVTKWLDHVAAGASHRGEYSYQKKREPSNAMTAEALLCRRYLGANHDNPDLLAGANHLLKNLPQQGKETSYYWYYATQLMFHLSPDFWKQWNDVQRDMLTETQIKEGPMRGTWDPKDQWEKPGGRVYATAMRVMMLEVYYRHQPLYKILDN